MEFASPEQAELAFYRAFERADLTAMMATWSEDDDIVCIHPGGQRLLGIDAIRESWRQLFRDGPRMRIELLDPRIQTGRMVSVHNLYERIRLQGQLRSHLILATNIYQLTPSGWRMVVHHASPLPQEAEALEAPAGTIH